MSDETVLDLADRIWTGEASIDEHHPVGLQGELVEVADRVAFLTSFANVTAIETGEGLVLVDSGGPMLGELVRGKIRDWSEAPVHTVIYSHGHVDHVLGMPAFDQEAEKAGRDRPRVIAHENAPRRFERYRLTAGYNGVINARQFGLEQVDWPTDYRQPDETFSDELTLDIGGERFELRHGRGETDDHVWTWVPGRKTICCGDFFIWAVPNAGNPQKAQRYPREWAAELREMEALGAERLLPGHGPPVVGADRVKQTLAESAELLESLVEQSLALMNEGAPLDRLLHEVTPPAELAERPYLQPVYDEPEFIVRNVWRYYGGWYDGDPAHLKPAPAGALAAELAELAGGSGRLAERARELAGAGELRLAGHLAELAVQAAPDDAEPHAARAEVNERRAADARSTMARGVFGWAAAESRRRSG